jgi:hypothetical protein
MGRTRWLRRTKLRSGIDGYCGVLPWCSLEKGIAFVEPGTPDLHGIGPVSCWRFYEDRDDGIVGERLGEEFDCTVQFEGTRYF